MQIIKDERLMFISCGGRCKEAAKNTSTWVVWIFGAGLTNHTCYTRGQGNYTLGKIIVLNCNPSFFSKEASSKLPGSCWEVAEGSTHLAEVINKWDAFRGRELLENQSERVLVRSWQYLWGVFSFSELGVWRS